MNIKGLKFLPYYINLKQDLPSCYKFEPRVFYKCRLLAEKKGGRLMFYHPDEGELLAAINSYYEI